MSNHKNYSKMYDQEEPTVDVEAPVNTVNPDVEVETEPMPVHVDEPKFVAGTVVGCAKLNVREHPNIDANVLCVLAAGSELQIDVDNKYEDWVHVFTATGREGYCMKQYIKFA